MKRMFWMLFSLFLCGQSSAEVSRPRMGNVIPLFALRPSVWKMNKINVCWEPSQLSWVDERAWVRDAIQQTWERSSIIRFVGWNTCSDSEEGIHIQISDEHPHAKVLGNNLNRLNNGVVLNFSFKEWSPTCARTKEYCIRAIAVHEFGHALGFAHEHNRPDTPRDVCTDEPQGTNGDFLVTDYDSESIMNYCNPVWNGDGKLSKLDIQGLGLIYGGTRPLASYHEGCNGPGRSRDPSCNAAIHRFCYVTGKSGAGLVQEFGATEMAVLCTRTEWYGTVSFAQLGQFQPACNGPGRVQDPACYSAAHRYCDSIHQGGAGLIQEVGAEEVALACVPSAWYHTVKISALRELHSGCTASGLSQEPACVAAVHRYCSKNRYGDGGVVLETGTDEVAVACLGGEWYGTVRYE